MARPLPYPASVADESPVDLSTVISVCPASERKGWNTIAGMLHDAEGRDAFEIHVEPEADCLRLRFRSAFDFTEIRVEDSQDYLQSLDLLQVHLWGQAVDTLARRGWFTFTVSNEPCLFQIDIVTSSKGPTFLLSRLDDSGKLPARLEDIGLNRSQLTTLNEALQKKNGLIVVASSLAQARRRTSRAIAQKLVAPDRKIVMADIPMHPDIPRTTQLGMDFPATDGQSNNWNALCQLGANAIVSTQPLEDAAARKLINQAAEHTLVVNTISASSASDCIGRLLGLGIRSEFLAHCLSSIVLQYRAKCLCTYCRVSATPDDKGTAWLARYSPIQAGNINDWLRHRMRSSFSEAEGCERCDHTGYRQHLDIFDIIKINVELRDALYDGDFPYVFSLIEQRQTLGGSLLKLAQEGIISLSEAVRVTDDMDSGKPTASY